MSGNDARRQASAILLVIAGVVFAVVSAVQSDTFGIAIGAVALVLGVASIAKLRSR